MSASLVGSEMCIRDSLCPALRAPTPKLLLPRDDAALAVLAGGRVYALSLIQSDAADDMQCVDLG
eukprot:4544592-Alexandrium_andersonii.AAC.1